MTTPLQGVRIVCIDDHEDTLEIVRFLLEARGAEVHTALTAAAGFELVSKLSVDIALIDLALPDEDGSTLIRRVRTLERVQTGRLHVIVVSAYCSERDRRMALAVGASRFLAKPFDESELLAALLAVLGSRGAAA